jgi:hypothetical protein
MKSLLYLLAGLLLWSAAPIWCVWFIYQVFALSAPFWYSVLLTVVGISGQVTTGVLMFGVASVLKTTR